MMRFFSLFAMAVAFAASLLLSGVGTSSSAFAQSNNNDFTPLNSRIRREQRLPLEPRTTFLPRQLTQAQRNRSRDRVNQFARCLWDRSNEDGLDLLERTDFGFVSFEQIGIGNNEIDQHYSIDTCLNRVARNANSSVWMNYDAASMRRWYIQEAYFDQNEDGPDWIQPGYVVGARTYPMSPNNRNIHMSLDFADCVVMDDPHGADFFFRTAAESDLEIEVLQSLVPAISTCLPQGVQMELEPHTMRAWLGEALWHVSNNLEPAPVETVEQAPAQEAAE